MLKQHISKEKILNDFQFSSKSFHSLELSSKSEKKILLSHNISEELICPQKSYTKNYEKYFNAVSKLNFCPLSCNKNIIGNYDNYLKITLSHIATMKNIKFNYALESPFIYENFPKIDIEKITLNNKKILLLDLDETLIHADFSKRFLNKENIKYDAIISFFSTDDDDDEIDLNNSNDESKDYSSKKILISVGIFIRPGIKKFFEEISKYFEIGIFTASVQEYADAAINHLDPENRFIKFRLYRNNCINVGNLLTIKDLRILKNINLKKIVLVDNNIYSFIPQLSNGILINSFYNDKKDEELNNVLRYLINFILPADDVRTINEDFFGFKKILEDLEKNSFKNN